MGNKRWSEQDEEGSNTRTCIGREPAVKQNDTILNRMQGPGACHLPALPSQGSSSLMVDVDACDSPEPFSPTSVLNPADWDSVPCLQPRQLAELQALSCRGVVWNYPPLNVSKRYTLHYGGEVDNDGHCLFSAVRQVLLKRGSLQVPLTALEIRMAAVQRFEEDYAEMQCAGTAESVDAAIQNQYSPNIASGWGVHMLQEVKLLACKADRADMEAGIQELMSAGLSRESAAESVYKERCIWVKDGKSWAAYMRTCGCPLDEYDIISLLYAEGGLLSVDENVGGKLAAFGDETAISSIANEFHSQVYVVQSQADGEIFFLPFCPRNVELVQEPPIFLFMKGSDWCGSGGDHYEPLVAREQALSAEKPFCVL